MRKTIMLVVVASIALAAAAAWPSRPCASGRCVSVQPLCAPGQRAICVCESDTSLKCNWICGSTR